MKKFYAILCEIIVILSFSSILAADFQIVKSPQTVNVDGKEKNFEVYNIDGNNFFKLRDIAFVLNQTNSQFSVDYNEEKKIIETAKGKSYTANGNEMQSGVDHSFSAVKSSQKLILDGVEKELLAYNIAGNNFFKLRDLGNLFDFLVDYNATTNTVVIESKKASQVSMIKSITYQTYQGVPCIAIASSKPISSYKDFSLYNEENKRIVVDIPDSDVALEQNQLEINQGGITRIRIGNQGGNLNRFVLDLESQKTYKVLLSDDKLTLYIALSNSITLQDITGVSTSQQQTVIDVVESGEKIVITDPVSGDTKKEYTKEELDQRIKITSVKYSSTNNTIKITGEKDFQYTEKTQNDGTLLVYDISKAVLKVDGPTEITPKNKEIQEIRFHQLDDMTVRIEIEIKEEVKHTAKMKNHVLEIEIDEKKYQNLIYTSDSNYGLVTLNDVKKSVFTVKEDAKSNQYTIKYSESRFTCGNDTLTISDKWLESISISTGKIILKGQSDVAFSMEQDGQDVIVKITKKSISSEDVITIPTTTTKNNTSSTTTKVGHTNTVNRTTKFTVNQISEKRIQVGKIAINNTSGIQLDLTELSKKSNLAINSNASVLIYHSHTTEGYAESGAEGNFHTTDNSKNVVGVGNFLEKYLKQKSITVLHNTTRHDNSYNDAYDESMVTVQKILAQKKYDVLIDLHRDAISSDLNYRPTATINGETCAKLMFVMGSDASGLYNPNWMENLKTAILIQNKAEEMYPGLFRDLSFVKYRYNQHLSPGAILIEVGATGNTMKDTENSMKYLANVLAALNK